MTYFTCMYCPDGTTKTHGSISARSRALVLSSCRMNPHSVLLSGFGRRICHLITVLFRPAFRETVVGRKPYFEIVGLRQSSHQKIRRSRFRTMPAPIDPLQRASACYWPNRARLFRPRGGSKKSQRETGQSPRTGKIYRRPD